MESSSSGCLRTKNEGFGRYLNQIVFKEKLIKIPTYPAFWKKIENYSNLRRGIVYTEL